MLWWEALGNAMVGALAVTAALWLLPRRFPARRLAAGTGMTGAVLGGTITGWVVGTGAPGVPALAALLVAAAGLSLAAARCPAPGHAPAASAAPAVAGPPAGAGRRPRGPRTA